MQNVNVLNLEEYILTDNLFGVNHMKVYIYNEKGELKYSGETFANFITTNIEREILDCKKNDKIEIKEIYSEGYNYKNISILIE